MKKLSIISLLVIWGSSVFAAPDSLFFKANKLFEEGLYEEATEMYQSVISSGYESASLYYNLGNAYFRSNKLGKARLYYEKALKLNPGDEDALSNLGYLQGLLADRFEEVPVIFYKRWIQNLQRSLSADQWSYFSIISFLLSISAILVYLLFRNIRLRKAGFFSFIIFFLLSLSGFIASRKQYLRIQKPDSAIVTDLSVNVKSSPRETGTGLFILHEGARIWLEDKTGGWQEIRLSDGRKGWVPEESIEAI